MIRITRRSVIDVKHRPISLQQYLRPFKLADILSSYSAQRVTHFTANGDTNYDINNERDDCETLFSWPGIGNWLIQTIYQRDYPALKLV